MLSARTAPVEAAPRWLPLRVTGWSMSPTLHDGDRIVVTLMAPERLRRGDVVYCHDGRWGLVHRVRRLRRDAAGWRLQTQGDGRCDPDPWWMPGALVVCGRVTAAWRGRRPLRVDAWQQRWWFGSPLAAGWLRLKEGALKPLVYLLQGPWWYGRLARRLRRRATAQLQEVVRERPGRVCLQLRQHGRTVAEVSYHGASQTLSTLWVRWPYRRLGLGRRLVTAVIHRAQAEGVARLQLEVAAGNWPARRLYAQSGFVEVEARPSGRRLVRLERRLGA